MPAQHSCNGQESAPHLSIKHCWSPGNSTGVAGLAPGTDVCFSLCGVQLGSPGGLTDLFRAGLPGRMGPVRGWVGEGLMNDRIRIVGMCRGLVSRLL